MSVKSKLMNITIMTAVMGISLVNITFAQSNSGKDVYYNDKVVISKDNTYIKDKKVMIPFHMIENFTNLKFNQRLNLNGYGGKPYDWVYLTGSENGIKTISIFPRTKAYRIEYINGGVREGRLYYQEMKDGTLYVSSDIFKTIFKKPILTKPDDKIVFIGSGNITNMGNRELEDKNKYPYITASKVEELIKLKGSNFRMGLEDFDDGEKIVESINKLLKDNVRNDMSDIEKLKAIHDGMCKISNHNVDPNSDYPPYFDTATGIAKYGTALCSGYAEYFMLACNAAGLDVGIVHGYVNNGYHAWNFIYHNGVRYNIDVIWDDVFEDIPRYRYFYKTDSEMNNGGAIYRVEREQKSDLRKVANI